MHQYIVGAAWLQSSLTGNVLGFMVDTKFNMSVQCVVKKAKSLLGCVMKDITRRVRQIKFPAAQYCWGHIWNTGSSCSTKKRYRQAGRSLEKEAQNHLRGWSIWHTKGRLSETCSYSAWRRKVLGSYLCNGMTRGIEKTELDSFGLGKEQEVTGKICELWITVNQKGKKNPFCIKMGMYVWGLGHTVKHWSGLPREVV